MTKERKILSTNQEVNAKSEQDREDKKHSSGEFMYFFFIFIHYSNTGYANNLFNT